MLIFYNPNPDNQFVGDCVIRAVSVVTGQNWETAYDDICAAGRELHNMPSADKVWGEYLYRIGFDRYSVRNTCPNCYTVQDFCRDHPYGTYILKTHGHVVAVVNGDYYDTFDSGSDTVIYYWAK